MSNGFFKFKQFTVWHELCAMKVGTDGVLLGAWASGGKRVLDVGTGSGLIALFMAQRFEHASITAIDIDDGACMQARENVEKSPFGMRIDVVKSSLQHFMTESRYDAVVCNPPFFYNSLKSNDSQRSIARHTDTLSYHDLFRGVASLLADDGEFSVVIPASCRSDFDMEALFAGLMPLRVCAVRTVAYKPVSRYLLSYGKHPADRVEETSVCLSGNMVDVPGWYTSLMDDFYL